MDKGLIYIITLFCGTSFIGFYLDLTALRIIALTGIVCIVGITIGAILEHLSLFHKRQSIDSVAQEKK